MSTADDLSGYLASIQFDLVQCHPNGIIINADTGLLEGDYIDRRMAHFYSMDDIQAKKVALEKVVRRWIAVMDSKTD